MPSPLAPIPTCTTPSTTGELKTHRETHLMRYDLEEGALQDLGLMKFPGHNESGMGDCGWSRQHTPPATTPRSDRYVALHVGDCQQERPYSAAHTTA